MTHDIFHISYRHLQETIDFPMKYGAFLQIFPQTNPLTEEQVQPHLRFLGRGRLHPPEGPDGSPTASHQLGGEDATKCAAVALHRGHGPTSGEIQGEIQGKMDHLRMIYL